MAEIAGMHRKDLAALLLGAAAQWLSRAARAEQGERVTVLVANPACKDSAYAQSLVVLQRGETEEVGVIIRCPSDDSHAGLVLWWPGELAEELERGLWLKLEVPPDAVLERDAAALWEELIRAARDLRT